MELHRHYRVWSMVSSDFYHHLPLTHWDLGFGFKPLLITGHRNRKALEAGIHSG